MYLHHGVDRIRDVFSTRTNNISIPGNHNESGKDFTDWRMPTKYELNLMNDKKEAIGNFTDNYYWSSTEGDSTNAWKQNFSDSIQSSGSKGDSLYVRAIRAF